MINMKGEETQYSRTGYILKTILTNNTLFFPFNKIITNNHLL